ncbi:MAG: NAD(P)-dependent oxidoreductase, partial [Ginsengibacter sp.]
MMNILIDMPLFNPFFDSLQNMEEVNVKVIEPSDKSRHLPEELIEDIDILFCTTPPLNHEKMRRLKMIQISSSGYTQLIGQKLEERNIEVCNALGVFDVPIAEWNIAMMISVARNLRGMLHNQDQQIWDRSAQFQNEIRGGIVGIWGYGGIGRETARVAKALGMKIHVLTRSGVYSRENIYCVPGTGDESGILPDRVFLMEEKELFLKELDFLIMAIPQTPGTVGIVSEEELKLLKPTSFILNPARGPLIQEQALLRALNEKWI